MRRMVRSDAMAARRVKKMQLGEKCSFLKERTKELLSVWIRLLDHWPP
jgi:hypothetical protein